MGAIPKEAVAGVVLEKRRPRDNIQHSSILNLLLPTLCRNNCAYPIHFTTSRSNGMGGIIHNI